MTVRVSVRLPDDVRDVLSDAAKACGVGLSTYLRRRANEEFKRLRKARIRARTKEIGEFAQRDSEVRGIFEVWGGGPVGRPSQPRRNP